METQGAALELAARGIVDQMIIRAHGRSSFIQIRLYNDVISKYCNVFCMGFMTKVCTYLGTNSASFQSENKIAFSVVQDSCKSLAALLSLPPQLPPQIISS